MIVLGISGGWYLPQEVSPDIPPRYNHDAAAVLIEDGSVVAAIEEERLNRIKHTNRAPLYSPRFCLDAHGITGATVDHVAFYWDDAPLDLIAKRRVLRHAKEPVRCSTRRLLADFCERNFGIAVSPRRLHFVRHHLAHAVSAFAMSGFDRSLVVTLDGQGEQESGLVALGGRSGRIDPIATFSIRDSLGYLYQEMIAFLGYRMFDEYKVMGLAPYGDPTRFRRAFAELYSLLPRGQWRINHEKIVSLYDVMTPRRKGAEFTQAHKDFAAATQAMLEDIVLHLLTYQRRSTRQRNLCLAGGVAHNCTMNGKVLAAGLFDRVFVQPASHDAGAALGAALHVYCENLRRRPTTRKSAGKRPLTTSPLEHLYWGTHIGTNQRIHQTLERWADFISFERSNDICKTAAALMADGHVLGWAQGRSEFGPRALGNRSIVADPRPAANKALINAMVKKREEYRPFAPSVLREEVDDYFVVPDHVRELPYMICVVDVREDKRHILGAVTHVDGTARVQTVSRDTNERFWRLIKAFKDLTGVPVVLNTSFNNNAEPIVDSATDAVVCLLTTGLEYVAIGDWLVRKKPVRQAAYAQLVAAIPPHYRLTHTKAIGLDWNTRSSYQLLSSCDADHAVDVSMPVYEALLAADGKITLGDICERLRYRGKQRDQVLGEMYDLWSQRVVTLTSDSKTRGFQPAPPIMRNHRARGTHVGPNGTHSRAEGKLPARSRDPRPNGRA